MFEFIYDLIPMISYTTIDKVIFVFLILFGTYIFNYFLKDFIRKYFKFLLYKKRRNIYYKFIFQRYDKLLQPIRIAINLLFLKLLISIFITSTTVDSIFSLIYIFILLIFTYEIIKFFLYGLLVRNIQREKGARQELFNFFLNITKIFLLLVSFLIILIKLGIDVTALIASFGIGGAIIALSAKDTLTNFFDSIRLMGSDSFRQGDWIQTSYIDGFVAEIGLTTTKVRTFTNSLVTIPNSKLANDYIKNWSKRWVGRKIKFNIRLKIKNDKKEVDKVIQEILAMLNAHNDIVNDEKIQHLIHANKTYEYGLFNFADKFGVRKTMLVYLDELDVYSMNLLVYVFSISIDWKDWLSTKQDVLTSIIDIIDRSSLELAFPKEEHFIKEIPHKKDIDELI